MPAVAYLSTSFQLSSLSREAVSLLKSETIFFFFFLKYKNRNDSGKETLQEREQVQKFNCFCPLWLLLPPLANVTVTIFNLKSFWNVSQWQPDILALCLSAVIHLANSPTFLVVQGSYPKTQVQTWANNLRHFTVLNFPVWFQKFRLTLRGGLKDQCLMTTPGLRWSSL